MPSVERRRRQPQPPNTSNNARLETLFSGAGSLNREYTITCPITPLYIDRNIPQKVLAAMKQNTRIILTPTQLHRLSRPAKKQVEVRASSEENGRVLEADAPIVIEGREHILTSKGNGATAFIRSGRQDYEQKVVDLFGKPREAKAALELSVVAFSPNRGWLEHDNAYDELLGSQELETLGIDCEKVWGICRINALPDSDGLLQPIDYFKEMGALPESADPVLLFRTSRENIRLQDIARLEDLGQSEAAANLLKYSVQTFAKANEVIGPFSEEDYFVALANKITRGMFPLFLRGYRFASHSWHDVARNISVVGEKVDVSEFKAARRKFRDVGDFLLSQGKTGNALYLTTIVLLRLAEQIRRSTAYSLKDAPDVLKQAASEVLEVTDFEDILELIEDTEVEKEKYGYYRGRLVRASELQWMTEKNVYELIEGFRYGYEKDEISRCVFHQALY